MNVVFRGLWKIIIDHMSDMGNIYASGCYISGNEYAERTVTKSLESRFALTLTSVAVNSCYRVPISLEVFCKPIGSMLGFSKNNYGA